MSEHPAILAAQIETMLMIEHLDLPENRPDIDDSIWVEDVPCGPSPEGIRRLRQIQERYGFPNVTTGNASGAGREPPPSWVTGQVCGVYVRADVVGDEPNFLRDYLSRD